jgi:hypothetical protein
MRNAQQWYQPVLPTSQKKTIYLRRKKISKINQKSIRWGIQGVGIFLYTGWTATSLWFMWCDALEPFNEGFLTPETLQFIPQVSEWKVSVILQRHKTRFINMTKQHLKVWMFYRNVSCIAFLSAAKCKTAHTAADKLVILSAIENAPTLLHKLKQSLTLTIPCKG